jgi:uncharacterized protein (TIGR02145 family)
MRYSIFALLMVLGWVSLGQSKKEQITVLTNRVDSLNLVLNTERTDNSQLVEQLNGRISQLESNVWGLEIKLKEKDSEIETKITQIEELRKLINVKSDSIRVLKAEVEKLKPTPKPVVPTNPIVATQSGPYKTVTIGTQVWMKENLNVSTFRNGDPIPEAKTDEEWKAAGDAKQPAWCYYNNDPKNGTKYGKLYNWYAVNDSRGLAPEGWHVPTDEEWTVLIGYLGGEKDITKKIKSTSGWNSYEWGETKTCPKCYSWNSEYRMKTACHTCRDTRVIHEPTKSYSGNGNNSSGFTALPGGYRMQWGDFNGSLGRSCIWWSATKVKTGSFELENVIFFSCNQVDGPMSSGYTINLGEGAYIRCIKD